MFSSLKLNSFKCQSNSASEKKKDKHDEDDDNVSDHTYEKLPNYDSKTCKCHSNYISRSPKSLKTSFSKRISKWRMECANNVITNLKISRPDEDTDSKKDLGERDLFTTKSNIKTKVTTVSIDREDGNLGITLRGGFLQNADLSKPVTITYIKPDGPVAREGTIKCGDRLLAVDGVQLQGRSLSDAQTLLRQATPSTFLTIEYDVNVLEAVEQANGPLRIEMEINSFQELGIRLGKNEIGIIIESVNPGSLADRCGALHVGDEILAVNSTRIDGTALSVEDIIKYIECSCPMLRLELLPSYATLNYCDTGTWRSKDHLLPSEPSPSNVSTLKSQAGRMKSQDCKNTDFSNHTERMIDFKASASNHVGFHGNNMVLTHSETIHTTLYRENGIFGFECTDSSDGSVIISNIIHGSPAERSQCLYPGDRILSINNRSITRDNLTAKEINEVLGQNSENMPCMKLSLHTEFDVLDSVVPTSGIFTVKLAKNGNAGLGITITASKTSGFMVCEMKKGAIAYRAGSLIPGDKILAINNIPLNQCSMEYAAHILQQSSKIVTLRVQRKDITSDIAIRKVIYTVELQRYGGPLGITIAGSEEPFQPITISGLSSGGLGEQTGVLHIGDEILAINNHSLYGEPLSKAHQLLQNSPDFVTLKISRSIAPHSRFSNNISPILPPSVDSAVESWDSSRLDLTSSPDYHQKSARVDCSKRNIKIKQMWPTLPGDYTGRLDSDSVKTSTEAEIPEVSLLDEITSENLKIKKELDLLSLKLDTDCKINLGEPNDNGPRGLTQETSCHESDCKISKSKSNDNVRAVNIDTLNPDFIRLNSMNDDNDYKDFNGSGCIRQNTQLFSENDFENFEVHYLADPKNWFRSHYLGAETNLESVRQEFENSQLYKVTLCKDPIYEDFGFSVSDGLYERGVFINRIRKGGPADVNNALKPYDRILQVNETFTQDFDCCLTVPLIASAGDSITLLIARNSSTYLSENIFDNDKGFEQESRASQNLIPIENDVEGSQRILV